MNGFGSAPRPDGVISVTKTEAAYQEIRRRIIGGELAPGSTVGQEALASDLGLSTTPVREALRRLEAGGWISLAVHREARIAPLSRTELDELYQVRLALDPLAAEMACGRIDAPRIARMRKLLEAPPSGDFELRLSMNREFHAIIYRACGNETLIEILDQLWDRADRYRRVVLGKSPGAGKASHEEHVAIVDALAAGDPALVKQLMHDHLERSLKELQPLMDEHSIAHAG